MIKFNFNIVGDGPKLASLKAVRSTLMLNILGG